MLALTATAGVLGGLALITDFPLAVAFSTTADNGDGTSTVTVSAAEADIPALEALGCAVRILIDDAEQLARWQRLDTQIDDEPPVA
jgi:hypothetical protein